MKLDFDQNISFKIVKSVEESLPDSTQVRSLGLENQSDKSIWKYAKSNEFTIVTFDVDFYELSILYGPPPKVIWLRTENTSTKKIAQILIAKSKEIAEFLIDKESNCLDIS